ncbi:related to CYT2 - holocytochrome-c1 synthase [Cephalotrichum gorgonifer]|uniref:Holocytochrome c-type synthase n=1 Tax=Cephalotrichum gorgonifer TaxID=2041049 RepID=A0AAE8SY81_9PEZI|nr:related to CYT2 - holocytochrome-c1 synthase [Cephalotrichum gorgonifer]
MSDSKPSGTAPADACPVDHKAREAWLTQHRANPAAHPAPPPPPPPAQQPQPATSWTQTLASYVPSASSAAAPPAAQADACPVDHKAREAWLTQHRSNPAAHPAPPPPSPPAQQPQSQPSRSWTQTLASYVPFASSPAAVPDSTTAQQRTAKDLLDTNRVVSSIPRSSNPGETSCPSNNETETGKDDSGNWVYPSEKMFFDAMRRKGMGAQADDMKTVVPIHNAVNERAWKEILDWEKPYLGSACDGPKLHSFAGDSTRMSPKARINTLLGYTAPFDRHDWVVDRCGTRVEYLIDFYAGRPGAGGIGPSFYLDVRPKLNSWEGVKMRALRGLGLS